MVDHGSNVPHYDNGTWLHNIFSADDDHISRSTAIKSRIPLRVMTVSSPITVSDIGGAVRAAADAAVDAAVGTVPGDFC